MDLNKGISTPIAILLIVVAAIVAGAFVWQFKPAEQPTKQASDYTTQQACQEAGYYWYDDLCHEEQQSKATSSRKTVGWKTYKNEEYGVKLKYPQRFQVGEELVQSFDEFNWYKVSFKDNEGTLLTVEVNPDGYGPVFSDRAFRIEENAEGELVIENVKEEEKSQFQELINFRTNLYEASNGNTYWIKYKAEKGSLEENLQLFKDFLHSFRFIDKK